MKQAKTKIEKLLEDDDKGVSSASGALSKILRSFWKDMGWNHFHVKTLFDLWVQDPNQEFDQDPTKLNNSLGNIRKDFERDELTWKLFTRNLRIMRPLEVRFLVRIKFKNGHTFRQIAVMKPYNYKHFNSDFAFKDRKPIISDEDSWELKDYRDYDDEGFHKSEKDYTAPNGIKINQIEFEKSEDDKKLKKDESLLSKMRKLIK